MTPYQFNNLSNLRKVLLLYDNATFVDERTERGYLLMLFQLSNFYVEIWIDQEKMEFYKSLCFGCTKHLLPYLDKVDLSYLIN